MLIEAKTMRMLGHAQHDSAEYVPKAMLQAWKQRDPLDRFEKLLTEKKLWDAKTKKEIDERIAREIRADVEFAENSPFPPPESAEEGVYCEGCHTIEADWKRPKEEVMPPRSSVKAEWPMKSYAANGARPPAVESERPSESQARKEIGSRGRSRQGGTLTMPETTYLEAIRQAMLEEMDRDPSVVLIGEDVGVYGGAFKTSEGLLARFGWERVIDTPISESAIVGAAVGMSYAGLRPIAEMQFIDFIACAFNMITNYAAKSHYRWGAPVPMVLRGPSGGGVHGGLFHSANPEMYFVHTPGLKVVCPATARDAKGLLKSAIRDNNPGALFRAQISVPPDQGRAAGGRFYGADRKGHRAARGPRPDHRELTRRWCTLRSKPRRKLSKEGIEAEVVDLRTLLPLDRETILASVRKTNKLLVVHEDTRTGGIAGEIAAIVTENAFEDLDGPIRRVTSLDTPVPYAPGLEEYFMPSAAKVAAAARELARY